jgi:hypothetical protein
MNENQPKVTIKDTTEVVCSNCGKSTFQDAVKLRRVSPLVSGQPREIYIPVPVFVCVSCWNVNDEFIPEELKQIAEVSRIIS